jgi:hypothetical protein
MTDGFGRRVFTTDAAGDEVEHLELAAALVAHTGFVAALSERVTKLADVRHASYVRIRRLDRPAKDRLMVVSDVTQGPRVADLLEWTRQTNTPPDIQVVVALMRQLLPAVALFSRHIRDHAIGAIAPERLFLVPPGRVVIADYVFGTALDQLAIDRTEAWKRFGVVSPIADGPIVSSLRGDAMALGVVALSLLAGRLLGDKEFPGGLSGLVASVRERHTGEVKALSRPFARWLQRALQIEAAQAFESPHAAQIGFEEVLASDSRYVTGTGALEGWIAQYERSLEQAPSKDAPKGKETKAAPPRPAAPRPGTVIRPPASSQATAAAVVARPVAVSEPDEVVAGPVPHAAAEEPIHEVQPAGSQVGLLQKVAAALAALVLIEGAIIGWLWTSSAAGPTSGTGELVVQSRPTAARVIINGEDRGATPLTLTLPSGTHVMEVRVGSAEPRVIPLTIRPGVQTAQYVEIQEPPTPSRSAPKGKGGTPR